MILTIDIGNTNISFGIFSGSKIIRNFSLPTTNYTIQRARRKIGSAKIDDVIICSVVPKVTQVMHSDFKRFFCLKPHILGKNIFVPINNLYRKPEEVGQDRLVNAYAGVVLYGAPLMVVDFGTAVTFDVISKKKEYLGGMILPGLEISLDALAERTALLPKIKLHRPYELIGRDTRSSMLSGIVYGFAALTDALVERIKEKIGKRAKVIGTGGNIQLMGKYCKSFNKLDRDLTLRGLNLIYRNFVDSVAHCHGIKENFY